MIRLLLPLILLGCKKPEVQCSEEISCPRIGEVCVEGACVEATCANSTQCPMDHYCQTGDCLPGCREEEDCLPGSTCDLDLGECVEEACASTNADCAFREFCNTATGECYDAGDRYCHRCDDDQECGEGNICYAGYCGTDCSQGQECPGGFSCFTFVDENGNPALYQCVAPPENCNVHESFEGGL